MDSQSSNYIEHSRKLYSLYVLQSRAIPALSDGLKAGGRRVLWTARNGQKYKSATLAGATMPIHPHSSPDGAINTLAAQYGNNIPLFTGDSAFGTLIAPTEYGAGRYTTVRVSQFTKDVIFSDLDIIPMIDNYDNTISEPVHFLPLVPIALVNPSEGIAVGYATNILPRGLDDIIIAQITHLKGGKNITSPIPKFYPIESEAIRQEVTNKGIAYYFQGELTIKDNSSVIITKLPYGLEHGTYIDKLNKLIENQIITNYIDSTKDYIRIEVKFKRNSIENLTEDQLIATLGLTIRHIENLNVVDFDQKSIINISADQLIRKFTDWRLDWYIIRYQNLINIEQEKLVRYLDIKKAIENNVGELAKKASSRNDLIEKLKQLTISDCQYIADLPVYRLTKDQADIINEKIEQCNIAIEQYDQLLDSEDKRKKVYISELKEILTKFNKGIYDTFQSK